LENNLTGGWICNNDDETFYGTYYFQQNGDTLWWLGKNTKRRNDSYYLTLSKGTIQSINSARNPAKTDKDLQLMLAKGKQLISYTSEE
jgi:hypothetical protein